jgi:hypothetical protein
VKRLPWRTLATPDPEHRYVVSVGIFVLDRHRSIPRFLRNAGPVRRILRRTPGLVGYTLQARFGARTFTEMAAFESAEAMRRFVSRPEHVRATRAMRGHLGAGSKIVTLELYGRDLPPRPDVVSARLEAVPGFMEDAGLAGPALEHRGAHHPA